MAMNLFGFTIIRTDELKQERAKNLQAIKELNEKVEKDYAELKKKGEELGAFIQKQALELFEQTQKEKDIELRKWCVEHSAYKTLNQCAEFTYRYLKHGDTSAIEDYDEFLDWRKKKFDAAKASEYHPEAQ